MYPTAHVDQTVHETGAFEGSLALALGYVENGGGVYRSLNSLGFPSKRAYLDTTVKLRMPC